MDKPYWPFNKIAIDLITDLNVTTSGNQHIITITDHLIGWPEASFIPNKKVDTIVCVFINNYHLIHMYSRYILSTNGMEFKNWLMDNVLQQLDIDHIFSAPYHPQSNGKLEVFHKYINSTLRKLCENDPHKWHQYLNQVFTSYLVTLHLATGKTPFSSSTEETPIILYTNC